MRKLPLWGFQAALVVGLGAAVALAADRGNGGRDAKPADDGDSKWSWLNPSHWFGSKDKAADKPSSSGPKKGGKKAAPKTETPEPPPPVVDEGAVRRSREEAALMRRWAVCQKLTEIALRTNDQELLRRADLLSERAWAAYAQRTGPAPAGDPGLDPDLHLDRQLDAPATSSRPATAAPVYTIPAPERNRRATLKEVDP
jgi:hypothetical protein